MSVTPANPACIAATPGLHVSTTGPRCWREPGRGPFPERFSLDIKVTEWVPDSLRSRSGFREDARRKGGLTIGARAGWGPRLLTDADTGGVGAPLELFHQLAGGVGEAGFLA